MGPNHASRGGGSCLFFIIGALTQNGNATLVWGIILAGATAFMRVTWYNSDLARKGRNATEAEEREKFRREDTDWAAYEQALKTWELNRNQSPAAPQAPPPKPGQISEDARRIIEAFKKQP